MVSTSAMRRELLFLSALTGAVLLTRLAGDLFLNYFFTVLLSKLALRFSYEDVRALVSVF